MPDISKNRDHFKELEQRVAQIDGAQSRVGWFETARYPDGMPVAYAASIQEFGYKKIPPRLGMRATAIERQQAWANTAGQAAQRVIEGKMTAYDAFDLIGLQAEGDFAAHIESVTQPPLSPITLGARKYRREGKKVTGATIGEIARLLKEKKLDISGVPDKPLDDTGLMIATLTHVTENTK